MKQERIRGIIAYLFTFFTAFFIFAMILLSAIRFTIMDQNYFLNRMNDVKYYENTATELTRNIKQQARGAGFEVETFDRFIKEEDIREVMIDYQKKLMNGEQATIDTSSFKTKLEQKINEYANANGIQINTSVQNALQQFVSECVNKYTYLTQFPYIDVYGQLMRLFQKGWLIIIVMLAMITIALFYLIRRLYTSKRKRKKYHAITLISAGLLIGSAPAVLYASRFFEKINLSPQYMYELLVAITKNLLIILMLIGVVMILIGIGIAYVKPRKKARKGQHKKERRYPTNEMLQQMECEQK